MDYRPVLQPVGPLPPRVYWTRRLALLAVLLVLIIAVAVACSGGSGKRHPRATTTPTTTPTPSTHPTVAAVACRKSQLAVTASTDAASYPAGALPHLQVSVRNTGSDPCVLTESPRTRSWTIVSGSDQIWTTVGCPAPATSHDVTLKPGGAARRTLVWNRHRSGKGCTTSTTQASPGTYQLIVSVNGITSAPAVFHLTG